MFDQLNTYIEQDAEARKTFNEIIGNKQDMFAAKLVKLTKLNDQYENILIAKETRANVMGSIGAMKQKIEQIQMDGLIFEDEI